MKLGQKKGIFSKVEQVGEKYERSPGYSGN